MNPGREITCAMCGHVFDAEAHTACQACPLAKGCSLVCCPACGYETVDERRSGLARLALRLLGRRPVPESVS